MIVPHLRYLLLPPFRLESIYFATSKNKAILFNRPYSLYLFFYYPFSFSPSMIFYSHFFLIFRLYFCSFLSLFFGFSFCFSVYFYLKLFLFSLSLALLFGFLFLSPSFSFLISMPKNIHLFHVHFYC